MKSESSFYLVRLQSLLGIFPIGAFILEHLYSNSVALQGPEAFNGQIHFLQSLPYVLALELGFIALPILLHAGIGIYIWTHSQNNIQQYGYLRNWLYTLQRWTGIVTILYIGYHVFELRIRPIGDHGFHSLVDFNFMVEYFSHPHNVVIYVIGVGCAMFHFANGIWNFLVKWGITIGPLAQRVSGYACTAFGIVIYLLFMNALFVFRA